MTADDRMNTRASAAASGLGWILLVFVLGTAHGQLLVQHGDSIGAYNFDGTVINSNLITGLSTPQGIAIGGTNLRSGACTVRPFEGSAKSLPCAALIRQYNERMKTMTATQARQSLGTILSRVLQGEDIGIVHSGSGRIVALRPVEIYSQDYALLEYGIQAKELKRAIRSLNKVARHEKTARWDGSAKSLRS